MKSADTLAYCAFLRSYDREIDGFVRKLREKRPDVVIALSRKAPRLLELLSLFGKDFGSPCIVTERAMDFLSKEFFKGKLVWVLDDIIIVGTTVHGHLSGQFKDLLSLSQGVEVHCLAKDSGWFQEKLFTLDPRISSYPQSELSLQGRETTIFCNELVRAFRYLNKPYDVDHTILYTRLDESFLDVTHAWRDKPYEISTSYQREIGRREFTFIPSAGVWQAFVEAVIRPEIKCAPTIGKWRVYYNSENGELALVPILTVGADEEGLACVSPFKDEFAFFNDLFHSLVPTDTGTAGSPHKANYSLFWWLTSYLWGALFIARNGLTGKFGDLANCLRSQDIVYLFGPERAALILATLARSFPRTQELLVSLGLNKTHVASTSASPAASTSPPDLEAFGICQRVCHYLEAQQSALRAATLAERVAAIFEGMWYEIELPFRKELREKLAGVNEYGQLEKVLSSLGDLGRLQTGLTWQQVRDLLQDKGLVDLGSSNYELALSLVLDLLVDSGVVIPIVYRDDSERRWERRYRYGEDFLSAKKMAVLFGAITQYLGSAYGGRLQKTPREKLYVLLLEKARKEGYIDLELAPEPGSDTLKLDVGMCIHGAVVELCESKRFFSSWLDDEEGGKRFLANPTPDLTPVSDSCREDMIGFAKALAHVDLTLDKGSQATQDRGAANAESEYLIALSSVNDYEPYLDAIREDVAIFLDEHRIRQGRSFIRDVKEFIRDLERQKLISLRESASLRDQLKNKYRLSLSSADKACNAVLPKRQIFEKRQQIAQRIDDYFRRELPTGDDQRTFYFSGRNFSPERKVRRIFTSVEPRDPTRFQRFETQLLGLASVCRGVSEILYLTVEFTTSFVTRTKTGDIHAQSLAAMERRVQALCENLIPSLNRETSALRNLFLDVNFPTVTADADIDRWKQEPLVKLCGILTQLEDLLQGVESAFKSQFGSDVWSGNMRELFPLSVPVDYYVVKYDVKGSTASKADLEKTRSFVRMIDKRIIDNLSEYLQRETIVKVKDPNEDGLFLAKSHASASILILRLLQLAEDKDKRLRIAVSHTDDRQRPFSRKRKYAYDDDYRLITRANEDPEIDVNYILSQRLLDAAESAEQKPGNTPTEIIEGLSNQVHTFVLSEQAFTSFANGQTNGDDFARRDVNAPALGRTHRGYIVVPNRVAAFLETLRKKS